MHALVPSRPNHSVLLMAGKATSARVCYEIDHAVPMQSRQMRHSCQVCSAQQGCAESQTNRNVVSASSSRRLSPHSKRLVARAANRHCVGMTHSTKSGPVSISWCVVRKEFRMHAWSKPGPNSSVKVSYLGQWLRRGVSVSPNLHSVCNPGIRLHSSELQDFGLNDP